MFRLAHASDLHFMTLGGLRPRDLLGKRLVGAANIVLNRRRKHRMDLLEVLGEDLRARGVDHVALTGDLGNVSLRGEWERALTWIGRHCPGPAAVTVIPGNHDAYVPDAVASGLFETLFAPYQSADVARTGGPYPFVRLRGEVALVALNSCVPTGDLGAWGQVGNAQCERLGELLTAPEVRDRVRVVLIHHPPVVHRGGEDRNLRDRAALHAVLERAGAELVLHGHDHRDLRASLAGPGGRKIPVVGVGSASYAGRPDRRARYNVYEIARDGLTAITYAHDPETGKMREAHRARL